MRVDKEYLALVINHFWELDDPWTPGPARNVAINPARVLATAWSHDRLENCRELLAAGEKAPPISVNRLVLRLSRKTHKPTRWWYTINDGNHRTVAAVEAEHQYIRAEVSGTKVCPVHKYTLNWDTFQCCPVLRRRSDGPDRLDYIYPQPDWDMDWVWYSLEWVIRIGRGFWTHDAQAHSRKVHERLAQASRARS